jgi:Flp pilus assembly protein TadD
MRCLIVFSLIAASVAIATARAATRGESRPNRVSQSAIEQLIAQLGDEEYAVRRRAEEQLLKLGLQAFDALQAAEDHDDLEIAERVQFIVQQMAIDWVQTDDPGDVRRLLTRYGDLSEANRGDRVRQLAELDDRAGLGALCRIARFEQSPEVSRRAATSVLAMDMSAEERATAAPSCLAELGSSERPPVRWIQLYLRELAEPEATIAEWAEANAAEASLLTGGSGETSFVTVYDLLDRHLKRCNELKLGQETTAALLAIIELTEKSENESQLEMGLAWSLRWIIRNERWDVLEPVEDRYEDEIRASRRLLYYVAVAADRGGRQERGQELAERAFEMAADDASERVVIADTVAELGRVDWAEREYRHVIEIQPTASLLSLDARSNLAIWLHDRGDYVDAADLLGEFCDAVDADEDAKQRLLGELREDMRAGPASLNSIAARREYYRACHAEMQQDFAAQRRHLEEASLKYDADPDILIAMYRSPGADEEFQQRTRAKIAAVTKSFQMQIDEDPDRPSSYNQWAWLVANTEGDQERAVKYSLRSLELSPEEPSYLDTLGRCYYAVGDLENAVKSQRRAIELAPHYQVMQRQLELFEQALAAKSVDGKR